MKSHLRLHRFSRLSALAAMICVQVFLAQARAAQAEHFATPDDAIKALKTAATNKNTNALEVIFGPQLHDLLSPDPVQAS
ncbi:MAG TPA: DUF2950 family protein, partial [Candidatus Cybelea sp.]|nr:DUF2950 family protein [Candidatus Cybelea sp.]